MSQVNHILQMVAQYAQLEQQLQPLLPVISKKLVGDLLATGMPAKNIARVIGRSPSYVQGLATGERSLSAQLIVKLIQASTVKTGGQDNATNQE